MGRLEDCEGNEEGLYWVTVIYHATLTDTIGGYCRIIVCSTTGRGCTGSGSSSYPVRHNQVAPDLGRNISGVCII